MARVTVEDCIREIPNRFDLVILAAQRAKQIATGVPLTLDRDNDKDSVVSLREIAAQSIDLEVIQEEMTQSYQKHQYFDHGEQEDGVPSLADQSSEAFSEAQSYSQEEPEQRYTGMSFIEDNIEVED